MHDRLPRMPVFSFDAKSGAHCALRTVARLPYATHWLTPNIERAAMLSGLRMTNRDASLLVPLTALVVEPATPDTLLAVATLSAAGFHATTVHTFEAGKRRLAAQPPSALLAGVQLGEYNGLHLVIRAKSAYPHMTAIVTCNRADAVLQAEAERLGATFAVKPIAPSDLLAMVCRTLFRRKGDSIPVRAPYERRTGERRVSVGPFEHLDRRRLERRRNLLAGLQSGALDPIRWTM